MAKSKVESDSSADHVFDLTLKEEFVALKQRDGTIKRYVLREINGFQRDRHLNSVGGKIKFKGGKMAGMSSYDGVSAHLIHLHMFCVDEGKETPVSVDAIQTLPASVQRSLYKICQRLSGLDDEEDDDDEAKND